MEQNMSFDRKYNIEEDLSETGIVTGIRFSVYGQSEILNYSVVPITSSDMNEGTNPWTNALLQFPFKYIEMPDCGNYCIPTVLGCMDSDACNYNPDANNDDGSCIYTDGVCETCDDGEIINNDI